MTYLYEFTGTKPRRGRAMHNLGTVFSFEVIRTLKKKSFWIVAASFPLIMIAVFGIIYFSNKTTDDIAKDTQNKRFSFMYTDNSNRVNPELLGQLKAQQADSKAAGIEAVKNGRVEAYFYYPSDVTKKPIEVYAKHVGIFDNSKYDATAKMLLSSSVEATVDQEVATVLKGNISTETTTFKDGERFDAIKQMIAPGFFLVLFYLLIAMFSNQMLTSTTEEKENRVIEMLLTTVKARTLIIGKILSLVVLALVQILLITIPTVTLYFLLRDNLGLPGFDATGVPFDAARIAIAAVIFTLSFLMFTGILVGIGAAVPTAKEANSFFGVVMIFLFAPLYAISLFVSAPDSPLVTLLTFFPLTAPIPLLLRNAVGNLDYSDALLAIGILAVCATLAMLIAVRIFRYGVLEYSNRLSPKMLFSGLKK